MIEDFGKKITGSAKDRWKAYRQKLTAIAEIDFGKHSFAEIFPEPNYKKEIENGADQLLMAFIRATREGLPAKPRPGKSERLYSRDLTRWVRAVSHLRQFCDHCLEGRVEPSDIRAKLDDPSFASVALKVRAYEALGHDNTLRSIRMAPTNFSMLDGINYAPPALRFVAESAAARLRLITETPAELYEGLREHFAAHPDADKRQVRETKLIIYRYKNAPNEWLIGVKHPKGYIDLARAGSKEEAASIIENDADRLLEAFKRMISAPPERRGRNEDRIGPDRRHGRDITGDELQQTFNLSGGEFGNWLTGKDRQRSLNLCYDALMDLSDVLGCEPQAIGLGGRLTMAFGARGSGGRNGAAAHYEPMQKVINLTKNSGAGSLAHEWAHALDNMIGRQRGSATAFGTQQLVGQNLHLTYEDRAAIDDLARMTEAIRRTELGARSITADKYASKKYFSNTEEMLARAFEAWVITRLDANGIQNDYLANILPPEVFEVLEGTLNRYPYPKPSEQEAFNALFEQLFRSNGPVAQFLGGTDPYREFSYNPANGETAPEVDAVPPGTTCRLVPGQNFMMAAVDETAISKQNAHNNAPHIKPIQLDLFAILEAPEPDFGI